MAQPDPHSPAVFTLPCRRPFLRLPWRLGGCVAALAGGLLLWPAGCTAPSRSGIALPRGVDSYVEGVEANRRGDRRAAIGHLETATEENPNLINARSLLGDLYRFEGDYAEALQQYEVVVKLDPYTGANYTRLGIAYQFLDRLREAESAYLKALELDATDLDATMNLGLVYLTLGRLEDARRLTQKATEMDPSSGPAWANHGVVLDASGEHAEAESALLRSLELAPDRPATLLNLGNVLVTRAKAGEAIAVLEKLLTIADSVRARKKLGDAYALARRYADALKQYETALKTEPAFYPALNDAGRVFITQYREGLELDEKLRQSALQVWRKSLSINPNQPRISALVSEWDRAGF